MRDREAAESDTPEFQRGVTWAYERLTPDGEFTVAELLAQAWGDGYDAGHRDARAVQSTYPDPTPNPYVTTPGSTEEDQ